ncbi:MAG: glutamate-5-semialdehyde dehydrogenase [Proteobacteria bacterium]|nr:glutamate-5-semialdehyde dehydrogenase [Pseudomonadota bacterium]
MKTEIKNNILNDLADLIVVNSTKIIAANRNDVSLCNQDDEALYDRLKVDETKIQAMQASILKVKQMDDPEGKILYAYDKESGLRIENRVVPFGTILIIYESRPDVTIEAAITAFKAGNKILLKGGKEARQSNLLLTDLWRQALKKNGQEEGIVQYLDYDRNQTQELIQSKDKKIDVIIPRGGEQLINSIRANTDIPMIISGRGNNFMYIDADADIDMAIKIIIDGKKRISVCNALDKVLIHTNHGVGRIKKIISALLDNEIEIAANNFICDLNTNILPIENDEIYHQEFLSSKILLTQINSLDEAILMINKYSGGHSAVIVTDDSDTADKFQQQVDCAAVYHNASIRYTDGGEFGLGAEIAISTQKLHFRGPVGLNELVTNKWFITGKGHVRG